MAVPLEIANSSGPDDESGTLVKKNPAESGQKDAPNVFENCWVWASQGSEFTVCAEGQGFCFRAC